MNIINKLINNLLWCKVNMVLVSNRDRLKSLNLWFFDRLIFDADQEEDVQIQQFLDMELEDPKICYQKLQEIGSGGLVGELNSCFRRCYIFTATTVKSLFSLGYDNMLDVYFSIPFLDEEEFQDQYDLEIMIRKLAIDTNSNKFSICLDLMQPMKDKIKNKKFYDIFEEITHDIDSELKEQLQPHRVNLDYNQRPNDDDDYYDEEFDINEYSEDEKVIDKFHAIMKRWYDGFSDHYLDSQPLFGYYATRIDEFKDEIANINTVTTEISLDGCPLVTRNVSGLTYQEISDMFKVYKLNSCIDSITIDADRNLSVTIC